MPRRSRRYSVTMSDFNNSSASEETSRDGTNGGVPAGGTAGNDNLDSQWSEFLSEHADDVSALDIAAIGRQLEFDPAFPERCNIEFAQPTTGADGVTTLRTRVWERGSGITMACGTGACATTVAAISRHLTDRAAQPRTCDIVMDGGTLHITWDKDDNHVYMTGPAAFAFDGIIPLPE